MWKSDCLKFKIMVNKKKWIAWNPYFGRQDPVRCAFVTKHLIVYKFRFSKFTRLFESFSFLFLDIENVACPLSHSKTHFYNHHQHSSMMFRFFILLFSFHSALRGEANSSPKLRRCFSVCTYTENITKSTSTTSESIEIFRAPSAPKDFNYTIEVGREEHHSNERISAWVGLLDECTRRIIQARKIEQKKRKIFNHQFLSGKLKFLKWNKIWKIFNQKHSIYQKNFLMYCKWAKHLVYPKKLCFI